MKLKTFSLINYRQFRHFEIEFSSDENKPITLVLGDNTHGKTTLVTAFLWTLYDENPFADKILINKDAADEMGINDTKDVKATLNFIHNGFSYRIVKKTTYIMTARGVQEHKKHKQTIIRTDASGNSSSIKESEIAEEINNILDRDLSRYFFFDGENNKIESVTRKTNLTSAVSNILGIKKFEKLRDYFNEKNSDNVIARLDQNIQAGNYIDIEKKREDKKNATERLEEKEQEISELLKNIDANEKILGELEEKLDANSDIKEMQEEKKRLVKENAQYSNEKENKLDLFLPTISANSILLDWLFAYSYCQDNVQDVLTNTKFSSRENLLKNITADAVDDIINRGYCICGTEITNNQHAKDCLIESKNHMEPRNFGKYIEDFKSVEGANIHFSKSKMEDLKRICVSINDAIDNFDKNRDRLKVIEEKLIGREDTSKIQKSIQDTKQLIDSDRGGINYIRERIIPAITQEISTLSNDITKLAAHSKENDFYLKCIEYSRTICRFLNREIDNKKKTAREGLQNSVKEVFDSIYHGKRDIVIDEDYKVKTRLLTSKGESLDTSKGLETVVNFSFVIGLMKQIKEKVLHPENFDEEREFDTYPLVMDAPFSNTDENHINRICACLPLFCDQIVIIVMEKDFKTAAEGIRDKIGKRYNLIKESETYCRIMEDNDYV